VFGLRLEFREANISKRAVFDTKEECHKEIYPSLDWPQHVLVQLLNINRLCFLMLHRTWQILHSEDEGTGVDRGTGVRAQLQQNPARGLGVHEHVLCSLQTGGPVPVATRLRR
jgi:hypothetical protein